MDAANTTLVTPLTAYNNLSTANQEVNLWQHLGGNLNFQSKLKNNRDISVNLDYLYYKDSNPSNYDISNFDSNDNSSIRS